MRLCRSRKELSSFLLLWLILGTSLAVGGLCKEEEEQQQQQKGEGADATAADGDHAATSPAVAAESEHSDLALNALQENETEAPVVIIPNTAFSRVTNPQFAVNYSKPLCRVAEPEFLSEAVPEFARVDTEQARKTLQRMEVNQLQSDLKWFTNLMEKKPKDITVCFKNNLGRVPQRVMMAWVDFFNAQGVHTKVLDSLYRVKSPYCTMNFIWAVKANKFFYRRKFDDLPHIMILEEPWFWRYDPTGQRRTFSFFGWDYLNGYSLRWEPNPDDRWNKYFADEVKVAPWIKPRPEGYALMVGQIPTDTAVMGARLRYGSIDAAYKFIIDSIKKQAPGLEIVYRPHPLINGPKVFCRLEDIEGVSLQFSSDISLDDALDQAAFVVAISSTALVQAVFRGVPVIALDSISPVWPVACHSFELLPELLAGRACRPNRDQWLADIAYTLWTTEEVRRGDAFHHMYNSSMKVKDANLISPVIPLPGEDEDDYNDFPARNGLVSIAESLDSNQNDLEDAEKSQASRRRR